MTITTACIKFESKYSEDYFIRRWGTKFPLKSAWLSEYKVRIVMMFAHAVFILLLLGVLDITQVVRAQPCCELKLVETDAIANESEIIDIFSAVMVSNSDINDQQYIAHGDFWLTFRYNVLLTKKGSVRVHILTDSSVVFDQGEQLGFHMYRIEMIDEKFYRLYQPNYYVNKLRGRSQKELVFEYFNFYRWLKYTEVMELWNAKHKESPTKQIKNILAIDADVLFLRSAHEFYFQTLHSLSYRTSKDFEIIMVSPGALQLFSSQGLAEYSKYIVKFFSRSKQEIRTQCDEAAGKDIYGRLYFNDMHTAALFSREREQRRSLCFQYDRHLEYDPSIERAAPQNRTQIDRCMVEKMKCVPTHNYGLHDMVMKTMVVKDRDIVVNEGETLPQCFMHFAADEAKIIMKVFAIYMIYTYERSPEYALISPEERHLPAPDWLQRMMNDQYMIRGTKDDMFVIRNGIRSWITSYPIFKRMHLLDSDVMFRFPDALMNAIPIGPPINESNVDELCSTLYHCVPPSLPCCEVKSTHLVSIQDTHRQHEYVDIFTSIIVSNFKPEEMLYISKGDFWLSLRYTMMLAKKHSVRIHVVTDSSAIYSHALEAGFLAHKVVRNETFYNMYSPNHISAMGDASEVIAYEYYNFYRWVKYSEIVEAWNVGVSKTTQQIGMQIENIIAIDADVMFLLNPHKFFFRALHSLGYTSAEDFDMATISPGAMQLFSARGLKKYADFIVEWYGRSPMTVSVQMRAISSKYKGRFHFSDMQMGVYFAFQNQSARSLCFQFDPSLERIVQMDRVKVDRCMIEKLECVPTQAYALLDQDSIRVADGLIFAGVNETRPQCFMHFQGDKAKALMKVYAVTLLHHLNHGANAKVSISPTDPDRMMKRGEHHQHLHGGHKPAPEWMETMMNDQIAVRHVSTGKLYTIQNAELRYITSMEVFKKMGLKEEELLNDFPDGMMAMIPRGPDHT